RAPYQERGAAWINEPANSPGRWHRMHEYRRAAESARFLQDSVAVVNRENRIPQRRRVPLRIGFQDTALLNVAAFENRIRVKRLKDRVVRLPVEQPAVERSRRLDVPRQHLKPPQAADLVHHLCALMRRWLPETEVCTFLIAQRGEPCKSRGIRCIHKRS